jgi:pectin methylesterase-like acyl-CoA thioesterase
MPLQRIPDLESPISMPKTNVPECYVSQTFYVDCSRSDNYTPNGSNQKPFKTINAAILALPPFTLSESDLWTICIMPGQYVDQVDVNRPVILMGTDNTSCFLDAVIVSTSLGCKLNKLRMNTLQFFNAVYLVDVSECNISWLAVEQSLVSVRNSTIMGLTLVNGAVQLESTPIAATCYISSDTTLEYPSGLAESILRLQNTTLEETLTFEFSFNEGGTITCDFSNSLIRGAIENVAGLTIHNYASVFLQLTLTAGVYENYAGYPTGD